MYDYYLNSSFSLSVHIVRECRERRDGWKYDNSSGAISSTDTYFGGERKINETKRG